MPSSFIIFDLEATCWLGRPPKGSNEVIEIGALKINEYGEFIETFERFIRPVVNPVLSGFCKRLTSIQQTQVNTARTFPRIIEEFREWGNVYDDDFYLCSWGQNDHKLLFDDCMLHDVDTDWLDRYVDLKNQFFKIKSREVKGTLKNIVKKEGFDFTGKPHRALSDAENLSKIFVKYFDEWVFV